MKMAIAPLAFVLTLCAGAAGSQPKDSSAHAVSREYNRALGVDCDHCHSGNNFSDASKPTFDFARRMERMLPG